ncbi:MAG: hypothetical protein MUF28_03515 [Ignavibacterium sp.]|nr:hypothetical protein [Ignavibacterium sp.]
MVDKERIFKITNERKIFFGIFISMFVLTEIIFFDLAGVNPYYKIGRWLILFITLGLIVYELVQYILPGRNTCDWRDIVATIIAGFISLGLYELIYKNKTTKEAQNEIQSSSFPDKNE